MNADQLTALCASLESSQRKLACLQAAYSIIKADPHIHPQRAILTAIGLPASQSLTGEELSDILIMWRAHVSEAVGESNHG